MRNYEKIIKRESGERVKIFVSILTGYRKYDYNTSVFTCKKGKRTWINVTDSNCYKYRGLSMEDRRIKDKDNQLLVVSPDELYGAKIEAWETMKPDKESK